MVIVGAVLVASRYSIFIPDLPVLFLLAVIIIATIDGSRAAFLSGLILIGYVAYVNLAAPDGLTYSGSKLLSASLFAISVIAAALIAGAPRRRAQVLRRALRLQRQRLSEAVRSKNEFMDAAAHELRTPLTVISGYASMIQDETFGRLPERFRDPVAAMQRKARELNSLIDEMLLAARVQQGTAPTATISLDVRDAVRQAVERAAPRVTLAQATLSYELPSTPVLSEVDPDHVAHILDSLINNALTYSDERPWVKITVTGGTDTRILVKDRGWGVPETMKHKIFERFVHYANPGFQPKSGRGLGLAVSRELAERYGGSLDLIRSEPGKGSLFVLRLPAAAV
jgi:two-component system CheB/CheR fusion protein